MRRAPTLSCLLLAAATCRPSSPPAQPPARPPIARAACVGEPLIPTSERTAGQLFPVVGPVTNADPSLRVRRTVRVPTRMRVRPVPAGYMVSWDPDALEEVALDAGCRMLLGSRSTYGLSAPGVDPAQPAEELTGAAFSGQGESLLSRDGAPGARVVRAHVTIFETDIPAQHEWMPESGRFRVLYERRFDTPLP